MELTVALCALREAENLRLLIPKIKDQLDDIGCSYDILIIDGQQSLDDTEQVCKDLGVCYRNQAGPHFGGAIRTAFQLADGEKLLMFDADGSHNPDEIPALYRAMTDDVDLVICSRNVPGGISEDAPKSQKMSRVLQALYRAATGVKATDFSTGYRLYRTAQVKTLRLYGENFDIMEEILMKLKLQKRDLVIRETPQHMLKRAYGTSKRSLMKFIASFGRMLVKLFSFRIVAGRSYEPERDEARAELLTNTILFCGFTLIGCAAGYALFALVRALAGVLPGILIGGAGGVALSLWGNAAMNFQRTDRRCLRGAIFAAVTIAGTAAIVLPAVWAGVWGAIPAAAASVALQITAHRRLTFADWTRKETTKG